MNRQLVWLPLLLILATGCRSTRGPAPVAVPARPAFVRPPDPVPVAPGANQAGYFMPRADCNACPTPNPPIQPAPQQSYPQQAPPFSPPAQAPPAASPPPAANSPPSAEVELFAPEPVPAERPATIPSPNSDRIVEAARPQTPLLPAGIPQFATAREGVSTGLRPALDDGLDWLQANNYKTVIHVRLMGEIADADRKQVEKRGMRYLAFEVSPHTLDRKTLDQFNTLVQNASLQPLFVYDRDGALAGPLWYAYFRQVDLHREDAARVRAGALGLRDVRDGLARDMWAAVQKALGE